MPVRITGKTIPDKDRIIRSPADNAVPMEKKVIFAFLCILIFPVLLFLIAGDWGWRVRELKRDTHHHPVTGRSLVFVS